MMKFLLNVLVGGLVFAIAAFLVPGVDVDGLWTAIIAGLVLGLINATVGLILRVMTLPLNFLTLGLVGFIVSVLMILLTDSMVDGFSVGSFRSGALFAIVLGLVQLVFGMNEKKS